MSDWQRMKRKPLMPRAGEGVKKLTTAPDVDWETLSKNNLPGTSGS
jgi:hypothetical protein